MKLIFLCLIAWLIGEAIHSAIGAVRQMGRQDEGLREAQAKGLFRGQKKVGFEEWLAAKQAAKPKPYDKDEPGAGPIIDV